MNKKILILIMLSAIIIMGCASENYEPSDYIASETENFSFLLTAGEYTHVIYMSDLITIGAVSLSSSPRGVLREFTGVPLVNIFRHLELDYSGASTVSFSSQDGFMSAVSIDEALDAANSFIVFEESGEALGTMEDGGRGPFMIVIALDPFPNRWARYLTEVIVR